MYKVRKEYQRKLNKIIKKLNKNIANDNIWKGRFELRQKNAFYYEFEDKSGAILNVIVRAYDKATGYYKDYRFEYAPFLSLSEVELWLHMNLFITEDSGVWYEVPNPRDKEFVKDYTSKTIPDEVMKKNYNFYLNYETWRKYN